MDIWKWFTEETEGLMREGHGQLARGLRRLPSLVADDRHDEVDAAVPQLLAEVRALGRDWLELYVRHWHLQSRIFNRMEGNSALGEAVSLVDLAHRETHRGCPQSVCAVQDLTACYSYTDGPGYAAERLAVTHETLARIDPTWACWSCISAERGDAMIDQGHPEDALAFIDQQVAARVLAGQKDAVWSTGHTVRMDALEALGRFDELLTFLDGCEKNGRQDIHERMRLRLARARALARLGRVEQAKEALPPLEDIQPTPVFYLSWTTAVRVLVENGSFPNDAALGSALRRFTARLVRQGVYRVSLSLAEHAGHLAVLRGAPHVARRALATMQHVRGKLRTPLDAGDRIARLEGAIAASAPPPALPDTADEVPCDLDEDSDLDALEAALGVLERAHERWPGDGRIARELSFALEGLGLDEEAVGVLREAMSRGASASVATRLGSMLAARGEHDEAGRIAAMLVEGGSVVPGLWIQARIATEQGRSAECARILDRLLHADPDVGPARELRVETARKLGDFESMLLHVEALLERDPRPAFHWDRMLAATITGAWDRVRSSAAALDLPADEGEGPIEWDGPLCRIRYAQGDATHDLWARRTGPVTARIVEITSPDAPARFRDLVAFDAAPLNPPPRTEEEEEDHTWLYPHVATLLEGATVTYVIDGVHPGDEAWQSLRKALNDVGVKAQVQSGERYQLVRPGTEEPSLRGLYTFIAVPRGADLRRIHELLTTAAAAWPDPLVWPDLAAAAGDTEGAARHRSIATEWRL